MPFPRISDHPIFAETDQWLVQEAVMERYAIERRDAQREEAAFAQAQATAHQMATETRP